MVESRYGTPTEKEKVTHNEEACQSNSLSPLSNGKAFPRRCSLKTSENYKPRPQRRRATIACAQGNLSDGGTVGVKRRSSITFQEKDDVKEVEPLMKMTDEPLWMTPVEHVKSKEEAVRLIRSIQYNEKSSHGENNDAENEDDDNLCTRGFEHYLESNRYKRSGSRHSRNLVFQEQRKQKTAGTSCREEAISQIYSRLTLESARRARQLGAQDFAEVRQEYRATKRSMARMSRRSSV